MAHAKDIITLIQISSSGTNALGDPVEVRAEQQVFADRLGISQTEMYQAMAEGIIPALKFKIRAMDYEGQMRFKYTDRLGKELEYKVVRKYDPDDEFVEITGESTVI